LTNKYLFRGFKIDELESKPTRYNSPSSKSIQSTPIISRKHYNKEITNNFNFSPLQTSNKKIDNKSKSPEIKQTSKSKETDKIKKYNV